MFLVTMEGYAKIYQYLTGKLCNIHMYSLLSNPGLDLKNLIRVRKCKSVILSYLINIIKLGVPVPLDLRVVTVRST